jgi:hypothetical protein
MKYHPDKKKWRTTPFPWFNEIQLIVGGTLATGRYGFSGGIPDGEVDKDSDDEFPDITDLDKVYIHPALRSSASSTIAPATPADSSTVINDPFNDEEEAPETVAQKRHKESAALAAQTPGGKKPKVTGLNVMQEVTNGISEMAGAIRDAGSVVETIVKDTADSTVQGQAQQKIQDETCLTTEGQLLMLDLLTNATVARTYLTLKSDDLRAKWLERQLVRQVEALGGNMEDYWIDWTE